MSRHLAPLVATALCLTLLCVTQPRTQASASAASPKKEARQATDQGESCSTCPSSPRGKKGDWINNFATAGRRTRQMHFAPVQRSVFDGVRINLVGTANGSVVFAATDLQLSGLMPLSFMRVYSSDRAEDRGLGAGWSFAYDDRVSISGDEAVLSTGSGAEVAFRREGQSRRFVLSTPGPGLHQSFEEAEDGTLRESAAGMTRTYRRAGGGYRLARVADASGNAISISFDRGGNVSRVEGVGGQSLTLNWSSGKSAGKSADKQPRLLAVTDSAGRRVSFVSRGGELATVVDQAGSRWAYEYAGGRLTGVNDPLGRVVLRARYDTEGRAVETGDAAGSHRFEYEEGTPGRTIVTDPVGAKTTFAHNALGAVSSVSDEEGQTAVIEYDESNNPVRAADSLGNVQTFASEAEGKSEPAASYRAVRNGRGQPVSLRVESGRELAFEYDAAGNETAFTYSGVGRFERRYDAAGRLTSERLPSGRTFGHEYDAHGQLARVADSAGRSLTIERDAGGLVKATEAGGARVRVTRDAAGRVTRLDAADGRSRQFAYDARGALTYYRDARGREYGFSYDRLGRMRKVDKSDGVTLNFRYGRDGRLASASRETRGQGPGFVKAGLKLSPPAAARDYEYDPSQCLLEPDGFGWYFDPCDPWTSYSDPDAVVTSWEYSRGGLTPIVIPDNTEECIMLAMAACAAAHKTCLAAGAALAAGVVAGCLVVGGRWELVNCVRVGARVYYQHATACDSAYAVCTTLAGNGCVN